MKYEFSYQTTASDFWQLSMYQIYSSMVGVCNIIFTVAMCLLTAKFWVSSHLMIKVLLVLACLLFIVFQPLAIYQCAKKRMDGHTTRIDMSFDAQGIHVKSNGQKADIKWHKVKRIDKKPTMLIIFTSAAHGYILTNKVLGEQKDALYQDILVKLKK
ncbi:MAG: YcxB family protein [Cellulosilyticum sp.]|nr:YcxB family protein [Cellulosilyticum sp.]